MYIYWTSFNRAMGKEGMDELFNGAKEVSFERAQPWMAFKLFGGVPDRPNCKGGGTGVPRSQEIAPPPPRTTIGPLAQAYVRVPEGAVSHERGTPVGHA